MNKTRKLVLGSLAGFLVIILIIVGVTRFTQNSSKKKQPRIVATTYAVVEIADKLNLKLVGVPKTENELPTKYQHVAKIGNAMAPSVEKIASLKPTAVYAVSVLKDQYDESFKKQKFHPQYLKLDTINDLKTVLTNLGNKYNRSKEAQQQIKLIQRAEKTAKRREKGSKPKVLILMGLPGAGYMIATNKSYVGDLVEKAGGKNVYTNQNSQYLSPNNESIATKNPDVILRLEHAMPEIVLPQFKKEFQSNSMWSQMNAVKNKRVHDLQQPVFNATANIHVSKALEQVSHWLYP